MIITTLTMNHMTLYESTGTTTKKWIEQWNQIKKVAYDTLYVYDTFPTLEPIINPPINWSIDYDDEFDDINNQKKEIVSNINNEKNSIDNNDNKKNERLSERNDYHEIAASLAGVKISETKIFVFVISSGFAGLAGVLYGLRGIVGPSVYPISLSLLLLTGAVLGGIRSIVGALIGSILVVFLPDLIEWLMGLISPSEQVANYLPAMISSLLLILTVVLNPGGIAHGLHHKKRHR
jgi:hypothetical protein